MDTEVPGPQQQLYHSTDWSELLASVDTPSEASCQS